ncbi:hypothetical protein DQ04_08401000 [Trypanosoma grayi]|uniref:hypothetical protein n=1 Tax=Trypanosoma grayi TaxID=71804 RepID=UPI0004F3EFA0|nr:hypothetical protein DQ04_08401000 [Trypanosoma grayi]KEG07950.1 hypothetical protein DQ04_08401000 [Trypanosoma grayi]
MKRNVYREDSVAPPLRLVPPGATRQESPGENWWDVGNCSRPPAGRLALSPVLHMEEEAETMGQLRWENRGTPVRRALVWPPNVEDDNIGGDKGRCTFDSSPSPMVGAVRGDATTASASSVVNGEEEVSSGRRAVLLCASGGDGSGGGGSSSSGDSSSNSSSHRQEVSGVKKTSVTHSAHVTRHEAPPQPAGTTCAIDHVCAFAQVIGGLQQAVLQLSGEVRELRLTFQSMKATIVNDSSGKPPRCDVTEPVVAVQQQKQKLGGAALSAPNGLFQHLRSAAVTPHSSTSSSSLGQSCGALPDADIIGAVTEGLQELEALPWALPLGHRVVIEESRQQGCGGHGN